jgi:hypothetical protein
MRTLRRSERSVGEVPRKRRARTHSRHCTGPLLAVAAAALLANAACNLLDAITLHWPVTHNNSKMTTKIITAHRERNSPRVMSSGIYDYRAKKNGSINNLTDNK